MSEHHVVVEWRRGGIAFTYETYSRSHSWQFDGGVCVDASASPEYRGDPAHVDPEEAFVAAISSCHMLSFLAVASRKRWTVDRYHDHAVGRMEKNEHGKLAVTHVTLRPAVGFSGDLPSDDAVLKAHEVAHENCFIANSVRTEIVVEPTEEP